ncbi:MAG: hypothetical protein WBV36_02455 [Terriglobales bacterium]
MAFQLWLRTLLNDAIVRNKAHIVALIGPHELRQLYIAGAPPSIESVFKDHGGRASSSVEDVISESKTERKIA